MDVSTLFFAIAILSLSLTVYGQYEGHLRLVDNFGNTGGSSGRLEVFFNRQWGTVCDDNFGAFDALVACQQLGYTTYSVSTFNANDLGFDPGSSSSFIWLDELRCVGSETRLASCNHNDIGIHNCNHGEDVGLVCSPSFVEGRLRLVNNFGSTDVSSGRLEVYYSGQWGTVCNDFFSASDANVACHQLGFEDYQTYNTVGVLGFNRGTLTWLDNLGCGGSENRLIDCSHNGFGNEDCSSAQDIALECVNSATINSGPAVEGDARLVGVTGLTRGMAGRVEVYTNSQWITVTQPISNGEEEADVICRQLGFPSSAYYGTVGELGFSQGSSSIVLSSFSCLSSYSRWQSCSYSTFIATSTSRSLAFAVSCAGTYSSTNARQSPTEGDLRLNTEGSTRSYSGRLEIYYNGQWGTICDDGFASTEADVACRQLGFVEALYYGSSIGFGGGSDPIWLDDLGCSSSHTGRLADCSHSSFGTHNCGHSEDVALVCVGEGSLRLTSDRSGSTSASLSSGRLEVYAGGRWGTVCDDGFGQTEADVACRQLGYSRASSYNDVRFSSDYDTSLPILLDEVTCFSSPNLLLQCSHRNIGTHDCSHSQDIEITCSNLILSNSTVTGVGIAVPVTVIILLILACVLCCYCSKHKKRNTRTPRVVNTVGASTVAVVATNNTSQSPAYPMQTVVQPYPTQSPYPTQYGAPYPTSQYASPYPTTYPTSPQQPPAAYPTGQAPPAPYPSGTQVAPAPYPTTGEQQNKPELYTDAPPAYQELSSYPNYTNTPTGPTAPGPIADYPPTAEQEPVPRYY